MAQNDPQSSRNWSGVLALALWLGTAVAGLSVIATVLDIALRVYAAFWSDHGFYGSDLRIAQTLRQLLVFPLAILWLAMVVGSGEYHYKRYGQPNSWKLFARTIAVEASIFVLAWFI